MRLDPRTGRSTEVPPTLPFCGVQRSALSVQAPWQMESAWAAAVRSPELSKSWVLPAPPPQRTQKGPLVCDTRPTLGPPPLSSWLSDCFRKSASALACSAVMLRFRYTWPLSNGVQFVPDGVAGWVAQA